MKNSTFAILKGKLGVETTLHIVESRIALSLVRPKKRNILKTHPRYTPFCSKVASKVEIFDISVEHVELAVEVDCYESSLELVGLGGCTEAAALDRLYAAVDTFIENEAKETP